MVRLHCRRRPLRLPYPRPHLPYLPFIRRPLITAAAVAMYSNKTEMAVAVSDGVARLHRRWADNGQPAMPLVPCRDPLPRHLTPLPPPFRPTRQ